MLHFLRALDELLVGVFPDVFISNGEFIGSSLEGTSILPTDSVVKAELPRDILISCSSVTATDVVWSSEGNITFRELTEDDLLGAMHNFDGSGSGSGRQTIVNDSIAGGADDFLTPVNGSFIFAMISSDAINEGTLECLSLQSGEKVALHFSSGKSIVSTECIAKGCINGDYLCSFDSRILYVCTTK